MYSILFQRIKKQRGRKRRSAVCRFTPQLAVMARAGPGQSQEPGASFMYPFVLTSYIPVFIFLTPSVLSQGFSNYSSSTLRVSKILPGTSKRSNVFINILGFYLSLFSIFKTWNDGLKAIWDKTTWHQAMTKDMGPSHVGVHGLFTAWFLVSPFFFWNKRNY